MINCENGIVKINGKNAHIVSDIICLFIAITDLLNKDIELREAIILLGADEVFELLKALKKSVKEVEDTCTEN